mmetsp:Transcript_36496/g.56072  ORF Transcript_36496/g.56072 Transcript_36496/m.56072 type:complete len:205 (+) Transcript_36496:391-1005(+)
MKLAAHFCGERVNEVLRGDVSFVKQVYEWGFERIQINATAVNGVDTSLLEGENAVDTFVKMAASFPNVEFIVQQNDETKPLWEGLLLLASQKDTSIGGDGDDDYIGGTLPPNISMLLDESKGTGVMRSTWPSPPTEYRVGYAGGIGPTNIEEVLSKIQSVAKGRSVWIDMESSLRTKQKNDSNDVFDLDKCRSCITAVLKMGFY